MPPNAPRRSHLVPRCYLRGFTTEKRPTQLLVVDADRRTKYWSSIDDVSTDRDFYRVNNASGDPDAAERCLGDLEDKAGPILAHVEEQRALPEGDDLDLLLQFTALLSVRTSFFRDQVAAFIDQLGKAQVTAALATPDRWRDTLTAIRARGIVVPDAASDYQGMVDFVRSDAFTIEAGTGFHVGQLLSAALHLHRLLRVRRWRLLHVRGRDDLWFATSDNPVCLDWVTEQGSSIPPGFGMRGTVVTVPLSRSCVMTGYLPDDLGQEVLTARDATFDDVATVNCRVLSQSHAQVYLPDERLVCWSPALRRVVGLAEVLEHVRLGCT